MKKYFISILAVIAAVGCNKAIPEENQPEPVIPGGEGFSIVAEFAKSAQESAGEAETKTVFTPPYAVEWAVDDELSVIAESEGAYTGYHFTKGEGNVFTAVGVSEEATFSDLYVIYPYSESLTALDEEGYTVATVTVGSGTQNGAGTGAHIDAPLWGHSTTTSVEMNHATTLFAVTVDNTSDRNIVVSSLKISNDQNHPMTGEFYLAPETGELKPAESAKAEAVIEVADGTVNAGEKGVFYVASAPFTLNEGQKIIVDVTIDGEVKSFEKYMSSPSPFAAGGINGTSVIYTALAENQHALVFQFTNKGITNTNYGFEATGGARQTDYFIVSVDGVDQTDYTATYYNDFIFESVDADGSPVEWTYAVRTGGHNSFTIGCDGNTAETDRTAYINVYFKDTEEYVVTGTFKNGSTQEAITDEDPILTFTVTQKGQEKHEEEEPLPEGDVLAYLFEGKGISKHWSYTVPSAAAGTIDCGWYGCTLNGTDVNMYDTSENGGVGCYSDLDFRAYDEEGQEVFWLDGVIKNNEFDFTYQANESAEPRTATIKVYYAGGKDYVVTALRHISADETDTVVISDPAVEPVYELIVTQPGTQL